MCTDCHGNKTECLDDAILRLIEEKFDAFIAKINGMNASIKEMNASVKKSNDQARKMLDDLKKVNQRIVYKDPIELDDEIVNRSLVASYGLQQMRVQ